MPIITDPPALCKILQDTRTVAILGASANPSAAGFYVPAYLQQQGYQVIPINPGRAGAALHGQTVRASLAALPHPVDMVDVFRRTEFLAGHADEILALPVLPKVVWFQLGLRDDPAARKLSAAGIQVVQDRCTLADHRALSVGPVA